jgi:hypothetical protein
MARKEKFEPEEEFNNPFAQLQIDNLPLGGGSLRLHPLPSRLGLRGSLRTCGHGAGYFVAGDGASGGRLLS